MSLNFLIVELDEDESLIVIPNNWYHKENNNPFTYLPRYKLNLKQKAIRRTEPRDDWEKHLLIGIINEFNSKLSFLYIYFIQC